MSGIVIMVTALRDVHELDGDLLLIFFVFSQHYFAKTALTQLLYNLIVVENRTKVEFLTFIRIIKTKRITLNSKVKNVTGPKEHYIVIEQGQTALIVELRDFVVFFAAELLAHDFQQLT